MTSPRTRLLAAAAACAAIALPAAGAAPASAATTCHPAAYPGQGYFTSLKATHISCSGARAVELGHYRCRTKHGINGKCSRFNGWRCTEKRRYAQPRIEFNSLVTCRKGSRRVVFFYQQNL